MKSDYFHTDEFKELLERYEASEEQGTNCFFDASEFCDLADYYLFSDRLNDAHIVLSKGLKMHPDDEGLKMVLGGSYIATHQFEKSREIIQTLDPNESNVLYVRAQLAYALDNDIQTAEELFTDWIDAEEEIAKYETEEEKEDRTRDAYLHIITSFIDLKPNDYDDELVKRWVEEYYARFAPLGRHEWDFVLADLIRNEGITDMIEKIYTSLLETDPYTKSGWMVLSACQVMNGHYAEAIESADFALAIDPEDINSALNKAHALYSLDRRKEALPLFQKYLDAVEDYSQYLPYAVCLIEEERIAEAEVSLDKFKEYVMLYRDNKEYYFQANLELSEAYIALNNYDQALESINHSLEIHPDDPEALLNHGTIYLLQDDIHKCIKSFSDCLAYSNDKIVATANIATRFLLQRQSDIALRILDTADTYLSEQPNYRIINGYRALAYFLKKDIDNFLVYLQKACQTCPDVLLNLMGDNFPPTVKPEDYYDYYVSNPF